MNIGPFISMLTQRSPGQYMATPINSPNGAVIKLAATFVEACALPVT